MALIDIDAFQNAALTQDPFPFLIVPRFVPAAAAKVLLPHFPAVEEGGSFPATALQYGPTFEEFCNELRSDKLRSAFEQKFNIDLTDRPLTLTVRSRCRACDGQIHKDDRTTLVTVVIYLNEAWDAAGGRLRLLRTSDNLDNYAAEVSPQLGTLVCFQNQSNAWYGHASFEGPHRAVQVSWVTDAAAARRVQRRHSISSIVRRLNPLDRAA